MRSNRLANADSAREGDVLADTDTYRMIVELDPERRARVGNQLRVTDGPGGEAALARRIAAALLAPGHVEALWKGADAVERTLLRAAASARGILGRGTLARCALDRHHSPAEVDARLARLEAEGLLLWRDVGFTPGYAVPKEIAARVRAAAAADTAAPATVAKLEGAPCDHEGAFLDDVVTVLAFLKRGAYRTTRGGAVHAADLRKLGARLVYPEDTPDAPPASGALAVPVEPFPTRLGLALDLVRRLLLVRFDPDDIKVDDRRVRQWLDRPADEIRRDVLKAARREPWRHQRELSAVADFLSDQQPGRWFWIEDVASALEFHPDFLGCRPEQLRARVQSGATYLCWLGAAAVSPEEVRPAAVSLTALGKRLLSDDELPGTSPGALAGQDDTRAIVLPTFEVLLPSAAPLVVRYGLEIFADTASDAAPGPMRRYALDKRGILQAIKGGLALEEIVAFLERHSTELPETVRISLGDWARAYGEYYFMNPTLLVCRDVAAATAARADARIAERILGQLSPEILILAEGAVEPIRQALEAAGSIPRAGLEEIPPADPTRPSGAAAAPSPEDGTQDRVAAITRFLLKRASDRATSDEGSTRSFEATVAEAARDPHPADAPPLPEADRRQSKLCGATGCARQHSARGLCTMHYQAARRGKMSFPTV